MKKLNQTIHRKLVAQAQEAKSKGLVKLGQDILEAVGPECMSEPEEYSYSQLKEDIKSDLWKSATRVIGHYNLSSVNAEKVQRTIEALAFDVVNELEDILDVDPADIGSLDPSVPGENK
jgi:hypothetical protein